MSDGADSTRRATRRRERAELFCLFHARLPQAHSVLACFHLEGRHFIILQAFVVLRRVENSGGFLTKKTFCKEG